jgi:hypothetical protein
MTLSGASTINDDLSKCSSDRPTHKYLRLRDYFSQSVLITGYYRANVAIDVHANLWEIPALLVSSSHPPLSAKPIDKSEHDLPALGVFHDRTGILFT